jgi:hypothetical protein
MGKSTAKPMPNPYMERLLEVQKKPVKDRKKMEPHVYERAILGKRHG